MVHRAPEERGSPGPSTRGTSQMSWIEGTIGWDGRDPGPPRAGADGRGHPRPSPKRTPSSLPNCPPLWPGRGGSTDRVLLAASSTASRFQEAQKHPWRRVQRTLATQTCMELRSAPSEPCRAFLLNVKLPCWSGL